tara:strand:- start:889 stop:1626 length:738 start_codon:yes stop_codon:yes gene_type:complete
MATLKELIEISGVKELAPGRTIGEQVYDSSINTVSPDTDLGSDTYTENIKPYSKDVDPFFSGLMKIKQPFTQAFEKYGQPVLGGLMSLAGLPGINFLMNLSQKDPYAQNRIDMYGAYRGSDGFIKDKFGYNVGQTLNIPFLPFTKNRFMEPGTSSYRSYALEGLRGLDPVAANDYYQNTYGLTFDDVKSAIQQKEDPFGSAGILDMGADYQGGGNNENQNFNDSRGIGGGTFGDATNDASFSDYS